MIQPASLKPLLLTLTSLLLLITAIQSFGETFNFTQKQRSKHHLSQLNVTVYIGDISGGQVTVSIGNKTVNDILTGTPLKSGQSAEFTVAQQPYIIKLKRLHNALLGEDFAEFSVSSAEAQPEPKPSI